MLVLASGAGILTFDKKTEMARNLSSVTLIDTTYRGPWPLVHFVEPFTMERPDLPIELLSSLGRRHRRRRRRRAKTLTKDKTERKVERWGPRALLFCYTNDLI